MCTSINGTGCECRPWELHCFCTSVGDVRRAAVRLRGMSGSK